MTRSAFNARRFALAGLLAAGTLLAGVGDAVTARAQTIDTYGFWSSELLTTDDGAPMCGVRTRMDNGAELHLMAVDGGVHLVAHDPRWHMRTDGVVHVSVSVDGSGYTGDGTAIDAQTILVPGLTQAFFDDFINGGSMTTDFGGVRWTVDLSGSSNATDDMLACVKMHRGYQS